MPEEHGASDSSTGESDASLPMDEEDIGFVRRSVTANREYDRRKRNYHNDQLVKQRRRYDERMSDMRSKHVHEIETLMGSVRNAATNPIAVKNTLVGVLPTLATGLLIAAGVTYMTAK
jgi:hypothetical protein